MAKKDELKKLLHKAASARGKYVTDAQIDKAAAELQKKAFVNLEDIRQLGESVVYDKEAFAVVDIGDVNDILKRKD